MVGAPNAGADGNGRAYLYTLSGDNWQFQQELAPDTTNSNKFGKALSVSGNYAIVGDPNDSSQSNISYSGAAYIFGLSGSSWSRQTKLTPVSQGAAYFGESVDIVSTSFGTYAIIGASWADSTVTDSGGVYIYRLSGSSWVQDSGGKLLPDDSAGGQHFGRSVAITENGGSIYAIVGADDAGAAYIFKRVGTENWDQVAKLTATDSGAGELFGTSVDISGDYAIIGASKDDDKGTDSGSAYIFKRVTDSDWSNEDKVWASDGAVADRFGGAVAISGDYAIIGAENHGDSGTAYVFQRSGTSWSQLKSIADESAPANAHFGNAVSIYTDTAGNAYTAIGAPESGSGSTYVDGDVENPDFNFAPTISFIPNQIFEISTATPIVIPFTVGDSETDDLNTLNVSATWTVKEGGNIVSGGLITTGGEGSSRTAGITPASGQSGSATVTISVTDTAGSMTKTSFVITITDPPTISDFVPSAPYIINEGESATIQFIVSDSQTPVSGIDVAKSSSNTFLISESSGLSLSSGDSPQTHKLIITPSAGRTGEAEITITAMDGDGDSTTYTFSVQVNGGPSINVSPSDLSTEEDSTSETITVILTDEEGGDLTLTAISKTPGLVANGEGDAPFFNESKTATAGLGVTFSMTITPVPDAYGDATISLTAEDSAGKTTTQDFTLTITPVTDPPKIVDITLEGNSIVSTVVEIDEDSKTGLITIQIDHPDATAGNPEEVTLSVQSQNQILIPDNTTPNAYVLLNGNKATSITINLTGNSVNIPLVLTPPENTTGTEEIIVKLEETEDSPQSVQKLFTLIVNDVNDAPVIENVLEGGSAPTEITIDEDGSTGDIDVVVTDEEGGTLTLTAISSNPALVANTGTNNDEPFFSESKTILAGGTATFDLGAIIPIANQSGTADITFTVKDDGSPTGEAVKIIKLTVNDVNDLPEVGGFESFYAVNEDNPVELTSLSACDPDSTYISLDVSSSDSTLFPNGSIQINYNDPDIGQSDFGNFYIIRDLVDGCDNPSGGLKLTLTPAENESGNATITITAKDDVEGSADFTFNVFVSPVNDKPSISGTPEVIAYVGEEYAFTPTADDVEDDVTALTFAIVSYTSDTYVNGSGAPFWPDWLSFDEATGALSGTPGNDDDGKMISGIIISVEDSDGGTSSLLPAFDLQIHKNEMAPTLSEIGITQTTNEDTALNIPFSVGDANGDEVTLTFASGNTILVPLASIDVIGTGVTKDADGTFRLTPAPDAATDLSMTITPAEDANDDKSGGASTITLTATDIDGKSTQSIFTLSVTSQPDDPTLSGIPFNMEVDGTENTAVQFTTSVPMVDFRVGDPDEESILTVTATSGDQTKVLDSNIKIFNREGSPGFEPQHIVTLPSGGEADLDMMITPEANQSGQVVITVEVKDDSQTVSSRFLLNIGNVNNKPEITTLTVPSEAIDEEATVNIPFDVRDWDDDTLTLLASADKPELFSSIVIAKPDGSVLTDSQITVTTGETVSLELILTGAEDQIGSAAITLTVRDAGYDPDNSPENNSDTETFTISIAPVNDPPTIEAIPNQIINEDNEFPGEPPVLPITLSVSDPDEDNLEISITSSDQSIVTDGDIVLLLDGISFTPPQSVATEVYGTAGALQMNLTPVADANGTTEITISVNDGTASAVVQKFNLTVNPRPDAPNVSKISDLTMNEDDGDPSVNPIPFTVSDPDGDQLKIFIHSDNADVVPNIADNLFIEGGTGVVVETIIGTDDGKDGVFVTVSTTAGADTELNLNVIPAADANTLNADGSTHTPVNISLTVSDGVDDTADATEGFALTIEPVNDPPTVSNIVGPKFTLINTPTDAIKFNVSDSETPVGNLIIDATSSDDSIVPDGNIEISAVTDGDLNYQMVITPLELEGETTITVEVTDEDGEKVSTDFVLKVKPKDIRKPAIEAIDQQVMDEDSTLTVDFTVSFSLQPGESLSDLVAVSASSSNIDLVPNGSPYLKITYLSSSGTDHFYQLTVEPAPHAPPSTSNNEVTVTIFAVTGSFTDEENFDLLVNPINDDPIISEIADDKTYENVPLSLNFTVEDYDGDSLTMTVSSSNTGLFPADNITLEGVSSGSAVKPDPKAPSTLKLTLTPAENRRNESSLITITANDGKVEITETFSVNVDDSDKPVISAIEDRIINRNETDALIFDVKDLEGGDLKISATSGDTALLKESGIVITREGVVIGESDSVFFEPDTPIAFGLSVEPVSNKFGQTVITLYAEDPSGDIGVESFVLTVNEVIPGDINNDGEVDLADSILVLQVLAGMTPENVSVKADISGDNRIGMEEAIFILQTVAAIR
ncbi:hypothetical protein DENIS_1254 [Desulfonema ishimotonii]|uniref:Dockerin domain-containing protein n=1 Tax=Desulfonema ishimotonii TaxID=45657 RepID=A0A401FTL8_9BACT|nr:Ig-like domain-containing protein [Desulfonema ishimotonii]GBC60303.1 hypothetical protein DENIS_1254 [Desulfonema ishimotonii]